MTDTENVFDGFALLGDDEEFDVDKIFGSGSDEPAPPPPAPTLAEEVKSQPEPEQVQTKTAESQPEPEQTFPVKTQEAPAEEKPPLELFSAFTSAESDPIPEAALVKSILYADVQMLLKSWPSPMFHPREYDIFAVPFKIYLEQDTWIMKGEVWGFQQAQNDILDVITCETFRLVVQKTGKHWRILSLDFSV